MKRVADSADGASCNILTGWPYTVAVQVALLVLGICMQVGIYSAAAWVFPANHLLSILLVVRPKQLSFQHVLEGRSLISRTPKDSTERIVDIRRGRPRSSLASRTERLPQNMRLNVRDITESCTIVSDPPITKFSLCWRGTQECGRRGASHNRYTASPSPVASFKSDFGHAPYIPIGTEC